MNAAVLLDNLNRAGAALEIKNGKPHIRGAKISDELLQALKANRAEVLAEFERRKAADRDRYGRVPPADAPMLTHEMQLPAQSKAQVLAHVLRQPRTVHAWVMARADEYHKQGGKADDCEWRACVDLIAWQRTSDGPGGVGFILELPSNEELGMKGERNKR